jgi:DNA-directed RNA polymerase specialized sigma24 family protein
MTRKSESRIEHTVNKAFLTAHLLTGSAEHAESAVMEALHSWEEEDGEEALFHGVISAAARGETTTEDQNEPDSSGSFLRSELRAVLSLPPQLRRCFVLHILAGLSRQACARLLNLQTRQVDRYTCAALRRLPFLAEHLTARIEHLV